MKNDLEGFPSPNERIRQFIQAEVRSTRTADTHAKLGFGLVQIIVILLACFAIIRCTGAMLQISETDRYMNELTGALSLLALFPVIIGSVWLLMIVRRLYFAFQNSIRDELRRKLEALISRLSFLGDMDGFLDEATLSLLKELGLQEFVRGSA